MKWGKVVLVAAVAAGCTDEVGSEGGPCNDWGSCLPGLYCIEGTCRDGEAARRHYCGTKVCGEAGGLVCGTCEAPAVCRDGRCNRAPGAPRVALSPTNPRTADDLRVGIIDAALDPDGDEVTYRFKWLKNGALQADLTADVVPAARTKKGEQWEAVVTATDGMDDAEPVQTDRIGIANTPPTVEVAIEPGNPRTGDELTVTASTADADGDGVSLSYAWTCDGRSTGIVVATASASETARGERWAVTVTPSDGDDSGTPATAEVTIGNTPPRLAGVDISPAAPTTTTMLTASPMGPSDQDGDDVAVTYRWEVDGHVVQDGPTATLRPHVAARGQAVRVVAIPSDGTDDGLPVVSSTVTVANAPPAVVSAVVSPSEGTVETVFSCVPDGWSDPDGDPEGYEVQWLVNGTTATTALTLDSTWFAKHDDIQCVATPFDGLAHGTPAASSLVEIRNTPPAIATVTIGPVAPREADTVSAVITGWSDPDGDTEGYLYSWVVTGRAPVATETVDGAAFDKGDTISVTVTPSDGDETGTPVTSNILTAENTPPSISSVTVTPTAAYTNTDLHALPVGWTDPDGDTERYEYEWYVNGARTGAVSSLLSASSFVRGDEVQVRVVPLDGEAAGDAVPSTPIVVRNTPPSLPGVSIVPAWPRVQDDLGCVTSTLSGDDDEDTVTFEFSWFRDGTRTAVTSTAVSSRVLGHGEQWTCRAIPSDGRERGAARQASVWLPPPGYEPISPGEFLMGSDPQEVGRNAALEVVHEVSVSRGFWLKATEVTQAEWRTLLSSEPSSFTACGDECPVETVSWHDAVLYLNAASQRDGLVPCYDDATGEVTGPLLSCPGYRFPTEAEWEYAARAGLSGGAYHGMPSTSLGCAVLDPNLATVGWYCGNSTVSYFPCADMRNHGDGGSSCAGTRPVGQGPHNAWGLYDMHGNVWEYVHDWFALYPLGAAQDPIGPASGTNRVRRGGCWGCFAQHCRAAIRGQADPNRRSSDSGLRPARTIPR